MLKYLFQVTYKNGSVFTQSQEDRSLTRPGGSAYSDVIQDEVAAFFLIGEGHTYSVDLMDGHFEVDGVPFYMHKEEHLCNFKLLYFRRTKQTQDFEYKIETDGEIKGMTPKGEPQVQISYNIGWQCDFNGKHYQEVLQIL